MVITSIRTLGMLMAMAGMFLAIYSAVNETKSRRNHPATRIPMTRRDRIVGVGIGLLLFVVGLAIIVYI